VNNWQVERESKGQGVRAEEAVEGDQDWLFKKTLYLNSNV
jgi:hypothetical protein